MGTYDDFNSPYGVSRSIHPGAVLLSPQLSSTSTPTGTITNNNNNNSTSGTSGTTNINNLSNAFNNMNIMNNSSTTTHTDVSNISNTLIDDTNNNNTNNYNYNNDNHNINIHNNNNDINNNNNNNNNMMTAGSVSNNNNNNNTKNNGLINLTQDINNICKWLTNMSSAQQNMVMDNIISTLKDDVLQYTKLKLDSLTNSGYLSSPPQPPIITSPLSVPLLNELNNNNNLPPSSSSNSTNMNSILNNEHTTTSTTTNNNINKDTIYHPWSPQPILEQQQARILHQRPKSAYPTNYQFQQNNDIGMISTLSQQTLRNENHSGPHLNIHNNSNYTNNGNSNYTNNGNSNYTNNGNSNYTNNNNSNYTNNNTTSYNTNNNMNTSPNQYQQHVSYNRSLNNRKIYSDSQYQQPYSYQSTGLHSYNNFYSFTKAHQNKHRHTDDSNNNLQHSHHQQQQQQQQKSPANTSMNPKNLTDPILLLDIPMWLKSLRLHKYSTILKDYYWEDLIELDDDFLNKKGVVALGARRKLLKAFTIVKDLKNKGEIDQKAFNSTH